MNRLYEICGDPERRHDFLLFFDVSDGNPNGDPDAGNMPRVDPETMNGLVTDVCIKRKVRNFVEQYAAMSEGESMEGLRIYVQDSGIALNTLHKQAYDSENITSTGPKQKPAEVAIVRDRMCRTYFDVRMFGAVMTTGVNCGQVRGPMQMTFSRSLDPITALDVSITRIAITKEKDLEVVQSEQADGDATGGKRTEMGRKAVVPYGLYMGRGFYSPALGKQTGISRRDLELFWDALQLMWDLDRSASRGMMACRGLYVFSHDQPLGNAPAHTLLERIRVERNGAENQVARSFADYQSYISVPEQADLPDGVTLTRLVG